MWIDTQKWKVAFKVDELYENFEYPEKAEVDKVYPKSVVFLSDGPWELHRKAHATCLFSHAPDSTTRRTRCVGSSVRPASLRLTSGDLASCSPPAQLTLHPNV